MSNLGLVTFQLVKNYDKELTCRCVRPPGFAYIVKMDGATVVTGICELCLRRNEHVVPGAPHPADATPAWARLPWVWDCGGWIARCGETTFHVRPSPVRPLGRWNGYVVADIHETAEIPHGFARTSADEAKAALVEAHRAWLIARLSEVS